MEFVYVVFIILAMFLGSVVNLYDGVWWYDLFTHFPDLFISSFRIKCFYLLQDSFS